MTAYIIEDEPMARSNLERLIHSEYPEIDVVGTAETVEEATKWLKTHQPQIVFMDIQLADGSCFDIFEETELRCPFIITTAYDQFALQAFEAGGIDYLLKPVSVESLKRAVSRCLQRSGAGNLGRMLLRVGGIIYPVATDNIAYAFAQGKSTYIVTIDNKRYQLNQSLEKLVRRWDHLSFFRISRSCLIARTAIKELRGLPGGRYSITTEPTTPFKAEVSRGRAKDFIHWLEHPL